MNAERSGLIKARERIERLPTSKIREIAVLDFCRQRGVWLISDEVYHRLVYDQPLAPSLLDLAEPEDKVIVINSFSKTWAMSGWRLGWITAPPPLGDIFEKVIEFHNSCPAHFSQLPGS